MLYHYPRAQGVLIGGTQPVAAVGTGPPPTGPQLMTQFQPASQPPLPQAMVRPLPQVRVIQGGPPTPQVWEFNSAAQASMYPGSGGMVPSDVEALPNPLSGPPFP